MPYKDLIKRREAARLAQARYRATEHGKVAIVKYQNSTKGKEVRAKINSSLNSKLARKRLKKTQRHIEARIKYDSTPERKRARLIYSRTVRGKAANGAKRSKRRALIQNIELNQHYTAKERIDKFNEYNNCCAYSNRPGCTKIATSLDHIIPISKGGSNSINNCVPACINCNGAKSDKMDWPWSPFNPNSV